MGLEEQPICHTAHSQMWETKCGDLEEKLSSEPDNFGRGKVNLSQYGEQLIQVNFVPSIIAGV